MSQEKLFTLDEIVKSLGKDDFIVQFGDGAFLCVRRFAADLEGHYITKAFRRHNNKYQELDFETMVTQISEYLSPKVNVSLLLKDVLHQADIEKVVDLAEAIKVEPKVTTGVQKGSCYYLYVGKKAKGVSLRLSA